MKLKLIPWLLLVIALFTTQFLKGDYFHLNRLSLKTVKTILGSESLSEPFFDFQSLNKNLPCHAKWLMFDPIIKKVPFDKNQRVVDELLDCSLLHAYFIRIFAPTDMELAQKTYVIYPEDPGIFYWLADGIEKDDPEQAEQLFRRIVELQPYNGRAWHRLGRLVEQRGLISEAITFYHNSCVNNDPGNHGCLNAGRLLEQEGRYEEAIYYYRLSRHDFIRANADRLEIEVKK